MLGRGGGDQRARSERDGSEGRKAPFLREGMVWGGVGKGHENITYSRRGESRKGRELSLSVPVGLKKKGRKGEKG